MYTEVHHHKSLKPAVVHNICGPPTPRGEKQAWKCWSTADGKRTRLFSLRALSPDSDNFKKGPVSSEHLKDLFLSERIIYGRIPEPYVFFFSILRSLILNTVIFQQNWPFCWCTDDVEWLDISSDVSEHPYGNEFSPTVTLLFLITFTTIKICWCSSIGH